MPWRGPSPPSPVRAARLRRGRSPRPPVAVNQRCGLSVLEGSALAQMSLLLRRHSVLAAPDPRLARTFFLRCQKPLPCSTCAHPRRRDSPPLPSVTFGRRLSRKRRRRIGQGSRHGRQVSLERSSSLPAPWFSRGSSYNARLGPLAHAWLEQRTHNPLVPGSTPGGPTIPAIRNPPSSPACARADRARDRRLSATVALPLRDTALNHRSPMLHRGRPTFQLLDKGADRRSDDPGQGALSAFTELRGITI